MNMRILHLLSISLIMTLSIAQNIQKTHDVVQNTTVMILGSGNHAILRARVDLAIQIVTTLPSEFRQTIDFVLSGGNEEAETMEKLLTTRSNNYQLFFPSFTSITRESKSTNTVQNLLLGIPLFPVHASTAFIVTSDFHAPRVAAILDRLTEKHILYPEFMHIVKITVVGETSEKAEWWFDLEQHVHINNIDSDLLNATLYHRRSRKLLQKQHKKEIKKAYSQYYNDLGGKSEELEKCIQERNYYYNTAVEIQEQGENDALQRDYDEFKQLDVDGDDRISRGEFNMYVKNYLSNYPGLEEKDYPRFEDFDHDRDGYVGFQEYTQQMALQVAQAQAQENEVAGAHVSGSHVAGSQVAGAQGYNDLYNAGGRY
jgi:hypothetical protein